jgi:hypothetical protein
MGMRINPKINIAGRIMKLNIPRYGLPWAVKLEIKKRKIIRNKVTTAIMLPRMVTLL